MPDELLGRYNDELYFIRQLLSKNFAGDHPKVAERLRLNADGASDDPHVERLIEAFAYLTARVRAKIDDEFPEISSSLLDVLYPHYQAPIPSMAVVQFKLDPEQAEQMSGHTIPRDFELETATVHGEACRFRTCYPVTLWPVELREARLAQAPLPAPETRYSRDAVAVLRLVLACPPETTFAALGIEALRFFIQGQPQAFRIHELIFNHALGAVVAGSPKDPSPIDLGRASVRPVGFEEGEGMLPYPARSFLGYRLLTEYFAFPQKFLFADVSLPKPESLAGLGNHMEVFIFLNRMFPDLARIVSAETFPLGCAPVVNLYAQPAEPFPLTHTETEYQVVPERRRPLAHEVYSVDSVVAAPPEGNEVEFRPFFSVKHAARQGSDRTFWHAARRSVEGTGVAGDRGTEVFLALVDLGFRPSAPADWTVRIKTTCLNRDLPHELPVGRGEPRMQPSQGGGLIARIDCLTQPTRTYRPETGRGGLWRLVSHLSLNHLSLVGDGKADALRELLKLYDFVDSPESRAQIDGVLSVEAKRVVGSVRTDDGTIAFCRGTRVNLHLDEERFKTTGAFLFASVMERFFALYSSVNSFSKLVATVKGREGVLREWPPRTGEKVLL